ncbi:MAG: curli production assembly protein CsgG [Acidobacteria bacterium]|nr:curli production assembly protein CsgG [Acidobacteriota bacterium]
MRTLIAVLISAALLAPAEAQAKKRVAVLNFDYATVQNSIQSIFGTNQDIGKGIADILVTRLVNSGVYSVIERKALDKVLAEQNFSNSDRVDPSSAAKIGKILGVDGIIIGSITQFGRDDKNVGVTGGAIGGLAGRYGLGGVGKRNAKAVVAINARLINTDTAEILAAAEGKGESNRSGATLLGSGGASSAAAGAGLDMSSKNFGDTILGEAVAKAVDNVAAQMDQQAARLPDRVVVIDGLVADVSGGSIVINVGSRGGVKVGDRLKVMRVGREIKDPATGRVLRRAEETLGELVITDVDEQSAGGTFSGRGPVKVGDRVKQ